MSQYISSFLIDPVVRQARRFSRPTDNSPHLEPRPTGSSNEAASLDDELAPTATAAPEVFPPLSLEVNDLSEDTETGPSVLQESETEGPQIWEDEQAGANAAQLQLVGIGNLEPGVNARRYTLEAAVSYRTSQNPLHGVYDGLRSTASSISSSTQSVIDSTMSPADHNATVNYAQDSGGHIDGADAQSGDRALPADDGMSHMRRRIIAIQRTDSSNEVKARLVHSLMTEKHSSSQQSLLTSRARYSASVHSLERPITPSSPKSEHSLRQTLSPTSSSSNVDQTKLFQLSPDDLKPTYYHCPDPPSKHGEQDEHSMGIEEDSRALGCAHYKRNIKLQCSACYRWYTCRFCHDAVEDHMLNRRETKNMLCMLCGCAQPASEECTLCSERGAWYYCDICKLWDDSPDKSIYHCSDCGICRVGEGLGRDFFHCKVSPSIARGVLC